MEQNFNCANRYTLYELLGGKEGKKGFKVVIPIIQRDYVQGRKDKKASDVRKNFIKDLIDTLDANTSEDILIDINEGEKKAIQNKMDLNFVYGNLSGESVFYPVDGQQRLTTLYLLHWYLAVCCDEIKDFPDKDFSYATRSSATEFFELLKKADNSLCRMIKEDNEDLKKTFTNQPWFMAAWNNDPTVASALTMLDDFSKIKQLKTKSEKYWSILKDDNCPIFFSLIIEEKMDVAEEKAATNYIRMNARGKNLEPFENLKSMIDDIDEKISKICKSSFELRERNNKKVDLIFKYDVDYIHMLFDIACQNYGLNEHSEIINKISMLGCITSFINEKSLNCFMNIYNIFCHITDSVLIKNSEEDFISFIHDKSKDPYNELINFNVEEYLKLIDAVYMFYKTNYDKNPSLISEIISNDNPIWCKDDSGFDISADYRKEYLAKAIYIMCYYENNSNKLPSIEDVDCFINILDNLSYQKWNDEVFAKTLKDFASTTAIYENIHTYFINQTNIENIYDNTKSLYRLKECGIQDIYVRIKEQWIKCKIIHEFNCKKDIFNTLEGAKNGIRKLQYLFYLAGYWNDYNCGDFKKLNKYIEYAAIWYNDKDQKYNDIEWRKTYAVARNCKQDALNDITLLNSDEINNVSKDNKHIWDNEFYFWDDIFERNSDNYINGEFQNNRLSYVKLAYEKKIEIEKIRDNILSNQKYINCWLTYAIKFNQIELLVKKLSYSETNCINIDGVWGKRNFMLYVYFLETKMNLVWGIKDFKQESTRVMRFPEGKVYYGNNDISKFDRRIDYQAYNMTLCAEARIVNLQEPDNIDLNKECLNCIYEKENKKYYVLIYFNKLTPSKLSIRKYDITKVSSEMENKILVCQMEMNKYTDKNFVDIYSTSFTNGQMWISPNGNSRTWKWKFENGYPYYQIQFEHILQETQENLNPQNNVISLFRL